MEDDFSAVSMDLDRQLCFALYATSRAMIRAYQPMLREFGITYPQYLVLLLLWQWDKEGKPAHEWTVSALGERLMLDSGTLTPLLKRMEKLGLVCRRRGERDERVTLVSLEESGRALQASIAAWRKQAMTGLAIAPDRLASLHRELWVLLDALHQHD
ncbi:MarR family winged helix-turn-helix transcriptional regulator [Microbulbifer sp. SA54]|uniref:MarR family winged helix-turn-helix transcriptional regulator n=1 Tax=Microbulbifer sp. SA54 TaxID=3401577 RepID=UPI003AAD5605